MLLERVSELTPDQARLVATITFSVGLVSLFASSLIINSWAVLGKGRGFSAMVVLIAMGDFIWSSSSVVAAALTLWFSGPVSYGVCVALRCLYQLGAWSSLIWALSILVFILVSVSSAFRGPGGGDDDHHRLRWFWWALFLLLAYGWGLLSSIIPLSVGALKQSPSSPAHCYPVSPYHVAIWFAPILAIFASCIILFLVVLYVWKKARPRLLVARASAIPFRCAAFPLVMLVSWGANIAANLMDDSAVPYALVATYAALLNAQGLLDALVYGLTNGRFRMFFFKRLHRTLVLLLFGPLLVAPLLIRRGIIYARRRCCPPLHQMPHHSLNSMPIASPSEAESLLSSLDYDAIVPEDLFSDHPTPSPYSRQALSASQQNFSSPFSSQSSSSASTSSSSSNAPPPQMSSIPSSSSSSLFPLSRSSPHPMPQLDIAPSLPPSRLVVNGGSSGLSVPKSMVNAADMLAEEGSDDEPINPNDYLHKY